MAEAIMDLFGHFQQRVGAFADVHELEYIMMLLQTGSKLRSNATVSATDIRIFLKSRYGWHLTPEKAIALTKGLGGVYAPEAAEVESKDDNSEEEELDQTEDNESNSDDVLIDLVQMLSLLLFPNFWEEPQEMPDGTMILVLKSLNTHLGNDPDTDDLDMNVEVLKKLFTCFQDLEFANNAALLQDMMNLLEDESMVFDKALLYKAITGDNQSNVILRENCESVRQKADESVYAASCIDYSIDSYHSLFYAIVVWCFFFSCAFAYLVIVFTSGIDTSCGIGNSFICKYMDTLLTWAMTAVLLSVLGLIIIYPLSICNEAAKVQEVKVLLYSILVTAIHSVLPYIFYVNHPELGGSEGGEGEGEDVQQVFAEYFVYLVMGFGGILVLCQMQKIINKMFSKEKMKTLKKLEIPPSYLTADMNIEASAKFKVGNIIDNACSIHQKALIEKDNANVASSILKSFLASTNDVEAKGGFMWTWKKIWYKSLFSEDGIWIHSRLIVGQIGQIFIAILTAYGLIYLTIDMCDTFDNAREAVKEVASSIPEESAFLLNLLPECYMIKVSSYIALATGMFLVSLIIMMYIPVTASTILKMRSGIIPTVGNPNVEVLRQDTDNSYLNLGNMIYAIIGATSTIWLLCGLCIFLYLWPVTQDVMELITAWLLGLTTTILLKVIIVATCRKLYYKGYYRLDPARANLSMVALESWHIGVGAGVLLSRLGQIFGAVAFWIGRLDSYFLHDDVSLFGYKFDFVPINYRRELLAHEAHRHPFIDRFGKLCITTKTRESNIATQGVQAWRRLFILALFPWIQKYSIHKGSEVIGNNTMIE